MSSDRTSSRRSDGAGPKMMSHCGRIAVLIAASLFASMADRALADEPIEIFDAHLHYNQEPSPFYSLNQVREVFRRNGIIGIVANSRPNKGTHELTETKWPELKVVPFIRHYRVRNDMQTWFNDPAIFELIKSEYARRLRRHRGVSHLRKGGRFGLGQEDGRFLG